MAYRQKHKMKYGYAEDGQKQAELREMTAQDAAVQTKERATSKDSLSTHTKEILAEIDELLADALANETAEKFILGFVQQGGE